MDPDSIRYQTEDMQIGKDENGEITFRHRKVDLEIRGRRQSNRWVSSLLVWLGRIGVLMFISLL